MTRVFSPTQALLVAKVGAAYVSPFIGRLDDRSENGTDLVRDIRTIYRNYECPTEVVVASGRYPVPVPGAARLRADIARCRTP
ncbi:MAG: transaldolase family protein [Thermoplasmata archaeon]